MGGNSFHIGIREKGDYPSLFRKQNWIIYVYTSTLYILSFFYLSLKDLQSVLVGPIREFIYKKDHSYSSSVK